MIDELGKIGVNAGRKAMTSISKDSPTCASPKVCSFDSLHDHRLAMTWAVLGMTANAPVSIKDFEAVTVSFPTFLTQFERLVH